MRSLLPALPVILLSGCAALDPGAPLPPDPWYASPPPVYVQPGWGHGWYDRPYWGRPYYHQPHHPHHPRPRPLSPAPGAAPPPAPPPAAAPPPPRAQRQSKPAPQYGHGEESFLRMDVPPVHQRRGHYPPEPREQP